MRLEVSPAADADLTEIASYIARDNVARAMTFIDELEAACAKLIDHPRSAVARSELGVGLRSKPHGSYVVFYTISDGGVRVERILHGARDIASIFSRG